MRSWRLPNRAMTSFSVGRAPRASISSARSWATRSRAAEGATGGMPARSLSPLTRKANSLRNAAGGGGGGGGGKAAGGRGNREPGVPGGGPPRTGQEGQQHTEDRS